MMRRYRLIVFTVSVVGLVLSAFWAFGSVMISASAGSNAEGALTQFELATALTGIFGVIAAIFGISLIRDQNK